MNEMPLEHEKLTEKIIGAAFEVHNTLGYGFLEKVYQKAMQVELSNAGIKCLLEPQITVIYKNIDIGHYAADLVVEDKVIVEIKTANKYRPEDEAQLLNELKATVIRIGMLINFGREKVEFKRMIF